MLESNLGSEESTWNYPDIPPARRLLLLAYGNVGSSALIIDYTTDTTTYRIESPTWQSWRKCQMIPLHPYVPASNTAVH